MDKPRIVSGNQWATELLKALGLDAQRNRRIIIDCEVGHPVRIYLENFADERLWDVRMPPLEVVEVIAPAPVEKRNYELGDFFPELKKYRDM